MEKLSRVERLYNKPIGTLESEKENRYFIEWRKTKDMYDRLQFIINYCDIEIDEKTGDYILKESFKEFLMVDADDYDEMLLHFNHEFTNTFETRTYTGKTKDEVVQQMIDNYYCLPFDVSDFETRKDISVLFSYDEQINKYVKSTQMSFKVDLPSVIILQQDQLIYRDDVIRKIKSLYRNVSVEIKVDFFDGSEKVILFHKNNLANRFY